MSPGTIIGVPSKSEVQIDIQFRFMIVVRWIGIVPGIVIVRDVFYCANIIAIVVMGFGYHQAGGAVAHGCCILIFLLRLKIFISIIIVIFYVILVFLISSAVQTAKGGKTAADAKGE
jgi:hypothetical protein